MIHYLFMAQKPPVGQGRFIIEASRSDSDTPHSVGLLWTSDQPDAETSDNKHSQYTDVLVPGGIRARNCSTADPQLRPRGHWDRHTIRYLSVNIKHFGITITIPSQQVDNLSIP
jgi:hypothetical protein